MNRARVRESKRAMRISRYRSVAVVLGLVAGAAAAVHANGDARNDPAAAPETAACSAAAAAKVQSHYESVTDISAGFAQTTTSVALGTGSSAASTSTTGRVVFAKPGKMRWAYETPQPSLVVSDGATLWIYDPASNEAQRFGVSAGYLTGAALSFLLGEGDLVAEFDVSAATCEGDEVALTLVPKSDSSYEHMVLRVVRATGEVLETSVVDLFGNVTSVGFIDAKTNTSPDPSVFEFVPPKDAQVIDLVP